MWVMDEKRNITSKYLSTPCTDGSNDILFEELPFSVQKKNSKQKEFVSQNVSKSKSKENVVLVDPTNDF